MWRKRDENSISNYDNEEADVLWVSLCKWQALPSRAAKKKKKMNHMPSKEWHHTEIWIGKFCNNKTNNQWAPFGVSVIDSIFIDPRSISFISLSNDIPKSIVCHKNSQRLVVFIGLSFNICRSIVSMLNT